MKTYKVKRGMSTYVVDADTRGKAKYAAWKEYKRNARKPLAFFPWVIRVKKVIRVDG